MEPIRPPWTVVLTSPEHDLILFGLVVAGLALLSTLVRIRFASSESRGTFRIASLTANAVVAIAFVSYLAVIAAFLFGYQERDGLYHPTAGARFAWELRYMDWVVTVPLLVLELVAVSALRERAEHWGRRIGLVCAAAMVVSGFLGAFIVAGGTDLVAYSLLGVTGAAFFAVLYALFSVTMAVSLPRLPGPARTPYRAAVIVLLVTWLAYPIVYGFSGVVTGGAIVVVGQLVFCAADMIAKIGFGTLVHRTAVLRSRNDENLDPSTMQRPRTPIHDSVWVSDRRIVDFDSD